MTENGLKQFRIERLEEKVDKIMNNDLEHLKLEIGEVKSEVGSVKIEQAKASANLSWLMKAFWVIATATVAGLVAQVFNILTK